MKLLLLVSLPLLASTNVTLAKSTLHEGRQKVSDSPDMSPRRLSSDRNLMQSTTSGTRHQAENAEERSPNFQMEMEELAAKLGQKLHVPALRRRFASSGQPQKTPEEMFLTLDFEKNPNVFESEGFKTWVQAVQTRDGDLAGDNIINVLREKVPDDFELALMLYKTRDVRPRMKEKRPYDYLLSKWMSEGDEKWTAMLKKIEEKAKDENRNPDDSLQHIWYDLAKRAGMDHNKVLKKMHELQMASIPKAKRKKPTQ